MALASILAISLLLATALFHYLVLRWLSGGMANFVMPPGVRVFVIVLVSVNAHLIEIALYAAAYAFAENVLVSGDFGGNSLDEPFDYLYFSIVSYTSLGLGDVFPTGHLRFITGVEALNGLLLIAWTGSFIFLAMSRLWPWQDCKEPERSERK